MSDPSLFVPGDNNHNSMQPPTPTPPNWVLALVPSCLRLYYDEQQNEQQNEQQQKIVDDDDEYHDHNVPPSPSPSSSFSWQGTGLALDTVASGHVWMSSMLLGPALLQLATHAAGCFDDTPDEICETATIYGFRPSSLLSNVAIVTGVLTPLSMPYVGALLDHFPHHRHWVGTWSALFVALCKGLEIAVGPTTWFWVVLLQIVTALVYGVHSTTVLAYTAELTTHPLGQAYYNATLNMWSYISAMVLLVSVTGLSLWYDTDDVTTARISQTQTFVVSSLGFALAWRYFMGPQRQRQRQGTSAFEATRGSDETLSSLSLLTYGFVKVGRTLWRIRLYRAFMWTVLAIAFQEGAMGAFSTIATTYLTQVLNMNASEIGLVFLITLVTGIVGSKLSEVLVATKGWLGGNVLVAALVGDVFFIAVTAIGSLILQSPSQKPWAYLLTVLWGTGLGFLYPVDTTLYMNLMPQDDESTAEFMGMNILVSYSLTWLPPLIFTALNELGFSMAIGLASLNLFFAVAILCLVCGVGDYNQALQEAHNGSMSSKQSMTTIFSYHAQKQHAEDYEEDDEEDQIRSSTATNESLDAGTIQLVEQEPLP